MRYGPPDVIFIPLLFQRKPSFSLFGTSINNWFHVIPLRPPQGSVKLVSTNLTKLVPLEQFHQKPLGVYDVAGSHRFVMELIHWHKVCELGGDKLHRPPPLVVALRNANIRSMTLLNVLCEHLTGFFVWSYAAENTSKRLFAYFTVIP